MLKKRHQTKAGLQMQMTTYVTSVVLLVSGIILLITAFIVRNKYERLIEDGLSDAIAATTGIIEQKMVNIESATRTMASLVPAPTYSKNGMDSTLLRALNGMGNDVKCVAMILEDGCVPGTTGIYERYALYDHNDSLQVREYTDSQSLERDSDWQKCYYSGHSGWSSFYDEIVEGKVLICYLTPVKNIEGKRIGLVYSAIYQDRLTSLVTEYKARKDIDVSIFDEYGRMIVAPDDYILELEPDDLIVKERTLNHLGWKLVFSAKKSIIYDKMRRILLALALLIFLLLAVISIAIMFTVRRIAKPYVKKQQQIEQAKAVMDKEMQLASAAQSTLVPHEFPPFPDRSELDLHACLHPARDVGGDLYDYFIKDDELFFCIGDVSGKGVQAALFMAAAHYLFRSVAGGVPSSEAVSIMNRSLCNGNDQCMFITFWFGRLNLRTGSVEYVNAGHNAPVMVHCGKADFLPASGSIPLGVWEENEFIQETFTMSAGDRLLLYTDGVSEAMDDSGHEFGNDRTLDTVRSLQESGCEGMVKGMLEKVRQHAGKAAQSDDITMLCIQYNGND